MIDMFATEAEAIAFALSLDPAPLMDGEIAQCDGCSRWGLSDEMRYCSESGQWSCDECEDKWHREAIRDAMYDVRGRLDWQERTGRLTLTV